ncbi:alpha/beta fold hydrolase [Microvirga lotononidis]|uniref:Putative hydrolase or acyltransferase of alpha/beta superfamily n=1 Tax=Microvirga lotononidis TaxID=864069 RepID=I4Z122_9HYPH|nr:alpha/beta hydrolase [Microvirga lotononidis]EIM29914.1 putative hydrolase or acyltransferase of alpha/beta superfamily [Microvirga lotononidis]WQO31009.1 alpha/beta hydrolase [Microvirga lotononidis]
MAFATTSDRVRLFYEVTGQGSPIVFAHEFGGNHWSWEPQVGYFSRRHQCVTYSARGYPPSDVPESVEQYSQARAADDIIDVMSAAGIEKAHIVGLSMGAFACVHAALRHPERVLSAVIAGAGYGSEKEHQESFRKNSEQVARGFEERGAEGFARLYAESASRVQFQEKDPRGWALFAERLAKHPVRGAANTMRGVQMRRPSLYDLEDALSAMQVPMLVVVGDEDDHSIQPGIFLKRTVPRSGLVMFPKTGHTLNLEEPALFNRMVAEFIAQVEAGRWGPRDPRADPRQIMRAD